MAIFKRRYPKGVPLPKLSECEPVAFKYEPLKPVNIFVRLLGWLAALCLLILYIPLGLYSVLCGGYFFGAPLAGGIAMDKEQWEEEAEWCRERSRLMRDENGKVVPVWEHKLPPEEKEELRLKRLSWGDDGSRTPEFDAHMEECFAKQEREVSSNGG
jgi:hypothetical protein